MALCRKCTVYCRKSLFDDATFTHLYAIAQAAPGPNVLAGSPIGWEVVGFDGRYYTLAMCLLMSVLDLFAY